MAANRHRMPFYARPDTHGDYVVNCTKDDVAAEIAFATNAGLRFWAFVMYLPGTALGAALQYFRELSTAGLHRGMSWCMILESNDFIPGHAGNAGPSSLWLDYVQDSNYLTVGPDKRPVVFIFGIGSVAPPGRQVFDAFTAAVKSKLGVEPYWIGMGWPSIVNRTLPVSGVGAYTQFPAVAGGPYAALAQAEEALWMRMATSGLVAVPTMTPNMDPRPMYELPNGTYAACPWCDCQRAPCHLPLGGGCSSGNCSTVPPWSQVLTTP